MKDKKKYLVLMIVSVMAFILITIGVTYSFFAYIKEGTTDNTIKAGSVSFIYEETNKMGNGIKIEDALPTSDTEGKESSNYFDFKVTSSTGTTIAIPYEITARKTEGSSDLDEYVKLYLTKVNGTSEQEVALSIYDNLEDSQNRLAAIHNDKTLYKGEIPVGATDYTENYRLRMWLNNDINDGKVLDYSPVYKCSDQTYTTKEECETNNGVWNPTEEYNNQGQTFSIKINVYANGETATEEKIASATTTDINGIKVNNVEAVENTDDTLNYDYYVETSLEEANNIELVALNDGQTYTVENITEAEANTLRQVSTNKNLNLVKGENYLKVTVSSANKQNTKVYVVKVLIVTSKDNTLHSLSIENCPLNETFSADVTNYTCETSKSNLTPSYTKQSNANVTISGENNLIIGNNVITITVAAEDTTVPQKIYTVNVTKTIEYTDVSGDSIISIIKENDLSSGFYNFKINGKTEEYKIHLYTYNENITINEDTKFGEEDDVSTNINNVRQYAKHMVIVKVNGNLTNNAKIEPYYNTTTGYGGPKGFMIYATGTLTNNGTIDNSHGAYAKGEDVYLWKNADGTYEFIPAVGALGATGDGITPLAADGRKTGGGSTGHSGCEPAGNGTSYSGGSGAGNGYFSNSRGSSEGGAGGVGYGAGNPGGHYLLNGTANNGTGGLLIIYANNYENNGIISANGTGGIRIGNPGHSGSSGGGSINIFFNTLLSVGSMSATGGIGGINGGAGTVNIGSTATGTYVAN